MSTNTSKSELGTIQRIAKFGLVGDGTVGKTTILLTYTTKTFVKDYVPTVFDNFSTIEDVLGQRCNVILWDTAGQEDYVSVRQICYAQTDVYFLCFSLVAPHSFSNIKSKWLPELRQHAPRVTLFLVGTKTDLVEDPDTLAELEALGEKPVSKKQALALQKEIGAEMYLTCSAKDVDSVNKVFHDALSHIIAKEQKSLDKERKQWRKDIKKELQEQKELDKMRQKMDKKKPAPAPSVVSSAIADVLNEDDDEPVPKEPATRSPKDAAEDVSSDEDRDANQANRDAHRSATDSSDAEVDSAKPARTTKKKPKKSKK